MIKRKLLGFSFDKTEKSQSEVDMSKCESLAKQLEKCRNLFHSSNSTTDGKSSVTYSRTWVPGMGVKNNCHARDANALKRNSLKIVKKIVNNFK